MALLDILDCPMDDLIEPVASIHFAPTARPPPGPLLTNTHFTIKPMGPPDSCRRGQSSRSEPSPCSPRKRTCVAPHMTNPPALWPPARAGRWERSLLARPRAPLARRRRA
nr:MULTISPECIES: hypothetical protein [unclassified Streptomyces]